LGVSAHVPSMTFGKVVWRISSAWATCTNSPDSMIRLAVRTSFTLGPAWSKTSLSEAPSDGTMGDLVIDKPDSTKPDRLPAEIHKRST
jgi:hypothetical protein